jgi:uracil-DNA glycosylase family 4
MNALTPIGNEMMNAEPVDSLVRCQGCSHGFARMVGSRGDPTSPVVIVGESPGKEEIKVGAPFVGPSGKVLEHALAPHQDIKQPYMLNAFQCFPGTSANKNPEKVVVATRCCQGRLHQAIRAHPRKVILALGNPAVWSTTGNFGAKITQVRGKLFPSDLAERGIVTAVHPAFLLRGGGSLRQFMGDVDYAMRLAKGGDTKRYVLPQIHVAKTYENIKWLAARIAEQEYVAADIETGGYQGFDFLRDRILSVGFCWDPHHVYVVPEELIRLTGLLFRSPKPRFIWHNGKFDQKFFWANGIYNCRVDEDTMLLSYAIDETGGLHDLEQVASDLLGAPDWKFMIKEYLGKGKTYADIPTPILHDYMSRDISGTFQVFSFLRRYVRADPLLERLYTQTLMPMSKYLARVEMAGMQPDLQQVKHNAKVKGAESEDLEKAFNQIAIDAGYGALNPRSPAQVGTFLYDTLQLRDARRPKKRPDSTDEATLLTLPQVPVVKILLKYREVQKGLGTYVNSIPDHIGGDGRIHTSYLIHGTTTGRLASRKPNLLNIPRDPPLRGQFVAADGRIYMEIDVNQAELRVLAELSRDPALVYIYTTPGAPSIHKVTQTEMFGDPEIYDEAQRQFMMDKFSSQGNWKRTLDEQNMRAKCVNFGIVYGRTAPSIAEEFKMPVPEAQEWINKWFRKYAVAREFILSCRRQPLTGGNLITPFGRKRRFQIVNAERLNDIQNQAANFPEQSIASDCVTHTGMLVQEMAYHQYDARIVNTVYDSLLFELPDDMPKALELGAKVLKTLGEVPKKWGLTKIPFVGDIKIGWRWGSDDEAPEEMGYMRKIPIPKDIRERIGI